MKNSCTKNLLCYNEHMLKTKTKVIFGFAGMLAVTAVATPSILAVNTSATGCTESPCETTFQVNVKETLSVALTTPQTWASGNTGEFLRNKVSLSVNSNNAGGFTASMHSKTNTNLTNASNSSTTIPTLSSEPVCANEACSAFPDNRWGYSLNDGTNNGTYRAMSTSAISLISAGSGTTTGSQDIYFGAKANTSQASGTYVGTVVVNVVAGAISTDNPIIPTNPAVSTDAVAANVATYDATTNRTVYYSTSTTPASGGNPATRTTATEVTEGDVTDSYVNPAGVTQTTPAVSTSSNIVNNTSPFASSLAITAAAAAAAGAGFFILAKRRDEEEDE